MGGSFSPLPLAFLTLIEMLNDRTNLALRQGTVMETSATLIAPDTTWSHFASKCRSGKE